MGNDNSYKKSEFKWYFRVEVNSQDSDPIWAPYEISINDNIEKAYLKFLSSNKKRNNATNRISLTRIIDFKENLEKNIKIKSNKQVLRSELCPEIIMRHRRFDRKFRGHNAEVIRINEENLVTIKIENNFNLNIFQKNATIILPEEIKKNDFFLKDFDDFKKKISKGLKEESLLLDQLHSFKTYEYRYLKKLDNPNFFRNIIKMYTAEGYIYRRLNKILRKKDFNGVSFQNFKYFYLALMYSLQIINSTPVNSTLYRGFSIKKTKVYYYKEMTPNSMIILHEFLSTTECSKVAESLINKKLNTDTIYCLMKIRIPSDLEIKLSNIEKYSEFPTEKEILLKSGTILQFNFSETNQNGVLILNFTLVVSNIHGLSLYIQCNPSHYLNISANNLGDSGTYLISKSLEKNTSIHSISLKNNGITDIGAKYLFESLLNNNTLQSLDLRLNNIKETGAKHLYDFINHNKTLHTIDISSNKLESLGISHISQALMINKSLLRLNIEGNYFKDIGAHYISQFLGKNNTLKSLDISNNEIGELGAKFIFDGLISNNSLESINISKNNISECGAKCVSICLTENKIISYLNISENKIGNTGNMYVCDSLIKNITLKTILLEKNEIGPDGAKFFEKSLNENSSLKEILLGGNNLGDKGAKYISFSLKRGIIEKIDLRSNNIGRNGAKYISKSLVNNNNLQYLGLRDNKFEEKGTKMIFESLSSNSVLETLDFSHNQIGDIGAKYLSDFLVKNTYIKKIDLSLNYIGKQGAKYISESLAINNTLENIDLSLNNIGEYGARKIAFTIIQNNKLECINLTANNIGHKGTNLLIESLDIKKKNSSQFINVFSSNVGRNSKRKLTTKNYKRNSRLKNK